MQGNVRRFYTAQAEKKVGIVRDPHGSLTASAATEQGARSLRLPIAAGLTADGVAAARARSGKTKRCFSFS